MIKSTQFPSKVIPLSASIIFMRPSKQNQIEVLLLKRNPKISFGKFYTFPGGVLEKQDSFEKWKKRYPEFYEEMGSPYHDFQKRICAIRETFEETNILIDKAHTHCNNEHLINEAKGSFSRFCKENGLKPDLGSLYGAIRLGSPVGFYPANDT